MSSLGSLSSCTYRENVTGFGIEPIKLLQCFYSFHSILDKDFCLPLSKPQIFYKTSFYIFQKTIPPTNCQVALYESFIFNLAAEWKLRKKEKTLQFKLNWIWIGLIFILLSQQNPDFKKKSTPFHLTQTFPLIKWKSDIKKTETFADNRRHLERRLRVTGPLSSMEIAVHTSLLLHMHDISWQNTYR